MKVKVVTAGNPCARVDVPLWAPPDAFITAPIGSDSSERVIPPPNSGQLVVLLIPQTKNSQPLCWHTVRGGFRGIETYIKRRTKPIAPQPQTIYDLVIRARRNYSKHFLTRAASKGFVPRCSRGCENGIQEPRGEMLTLVAVESRCNDVLSWFCQRVFFARRRRSNCAKSA